MSHPEIRKKVVAMWNEGAVCNKIVSALGLTRGQVMGFVHRAQRMGLAERRSGEPRKPKHRPVAAPMPRGKVTLALVSLQREPEMPKKPVEPPQPQLPLRQPKTITQLGPFDCRWIRPDKKYCGYPAKSARTPWCDDHYKMVYVPLSNRRGS